jgi:hypothetical protein
MAMNRRTLILAILDIRSSYLQDRQEPAERHTPDTVQWWLAEQGSWRIQTFGIDHDIHLHHVTGGDAEYFAERTRRNYAEVLRELYTLEFEDYTNEAEVRRVLTEAGLRPDLEISDHGFAFWNPDQGRYRTQSYPSE